MLPSVPQMLIVLAVIVLVFGLGKLRTAGEDLGGMFKGIRKGFEDDPESLEQFNSAVSDVKDTVTSSVKREVNKVRSR